ncbi:MULTISPECIES: pilus assembly protein PilP [Nitrosomonas]|uniref:Pilus assembly protein PilP n=1 Tax=Nitrosomonas communis TaxID=44574 RepID=A0A0F7KE86_9PROT|nr:MULTISPECIES: pilus assembly protein PilP [Nitrosomonas]AKH37418.1 pilus assembly protein PilP [Nitrosomonas communis]TYP91395.1 type IV pilus assembly protein PilP [Nitrosomonas communis]UVS62645.1 pilus assembly protein PilP [Nitrosomonas sp. PLL12]
MIKWFPHLWRVWLVIVSASACSEGTYNDLEEFVNQSGEGLRGKVDPLPQIRPFAQFNYEAFNVSDPFNAQKNIPSSKHDTLQPDLKRRKEALENFPLENLTMVGTLQRNKQIFALVRTPDNTVHRVKAGNYLGQNFGLITDISETEIKLKEIVQDGVHVWIERLSTLVLQVQVQK